MCHLSPAALCANSSGIHFARKYLKIHMENANRRATLFDRPPFESRLYCLVGASKWCSFICQQLLNNAASANFIFGLYVQLKKPLCGCLLMKNTCSTTCNWRCRRLMCEHGKAFATAVAGSPLPFVDSHFICTNAPLEDVSSMAKTKAGRDTPPIPAFRPSACQTSQQTKLQFCPCWPLDLL